jgi:hypothetical protein
MAYFEVNEVKEREDTIKTVYMNGDLPEINTYSPIKLLGICAKMEKIFIFPEN